MFNHLSNDIMHFWIKYPEVVEKISVESEIEFLISEKFIETNSQKLKEWLEQQKRQFNMRGTKSLTKFDLEPPYESPIGSNPFMEFEPPID